MYDIISLTDSITAALQERMNKLTFRWKNSASTAEDDYHETKPRVSSYCYDYVNDDNLPDEMPSILVQVLSESGGVVTYCVFICTVHPGTQDIEKTVPVQQASSVYKHIDSPDYTGLGCRLELYKTCLLLADQVSLALKRLANDGFPISDVEMTAPSPLLPDFPYCTATVTCSCRISQVGSKIDTKLASLL